MAENYRLCGAVNSSQCFEGYVCIRQPPQLGYCATIDSAHGCGGRLQPWRDPWVFQPPKTNPGSGPGNPSGSKPRKL